MARVLYVDEQALERQAFVARFGGDFEVMCAASGREALDLLGRDVDVIVSDQHMSPMRGCDLLALAAEASPDLQRILVSSTRDHDELAEAVNRAHLFAYFPKPWDEQELRLTIDRAAKQRRKLQDVVPTTPRGSTSMRPSLLATSAPMQKVLAQVSAVAGTDASILLHGETGTGKELIAAEIHERSGRRKARFVAQNLAALPPELMTSELFGHVKGAFTGAQQARRGLFELADGGTLFLDEIGEAPMSLQALLLRALESHEFWPVGASEPRQVDVRIVAATNRDLLADAQQGLFRLDLYYRLAVCPIEVPPLRARTDDVRGIGVPLLEAAARRMHRAEPRIGEAAWSALEAHPWPGNVRELGNVMERLVIYHPGRDVEPDDLGLPPRPATASSRPSVDPATTIDFDVDAIAPVALSLELPEGGTTFDDLEREILAQVLARADHNQSRAARSLGMSESTFRSRMKRLGLKS